MANEPVSALTNNNGTPAEQSKGAKNRARSVDTGAFNNAPIRLSHVQPQPAPVAQHQYHHRHRPQPTANVAPVVENRTETNVPAVWNSIILERQFESFPFFRRNQQVQEVPKN